MGVGRNNKFAIKTEIKDAGRGEKVGYKPARGEVSLQEVISREQYYMQCKSCKQKLNLESCLLLLKADNPQDMVLSCKHRE